MNNPALVVFVCLTRLYSPGVPILAAVADDDMDAPERAHLAEQMAFVRDGPDQCGESTVPTKWTLDVLSLYMGVAKNARRENEIAAKQDYLAALKAKIGVEEWCDLYRVEMSEADVMVNLLTEHLSCGLVLHLRGRGDDWERI